MGNSYKVLVIEDDFKIAEINLQFVEKVKGFTVIGKASTAAEALKMLKEEVPDLILLDVYIPDVEGLELLWKIRQNYKNIDVIAVTAAKEVATVEEAMRGGVVDYIIKPINFDRLKQALLDYARKKRFLYDTSSMTQNDIDQYRSISSTSENKEPKNDLPKGISLLTLQKVQQVMEAYITQGITAGELGNIIGVSRITARRYLEYMILINKVRAQLRYGDVGRPERRYYKASDSTRE